VFPVWRLTADGLEAWGQVIERGYEGYVAKDEASPYEGGPTRQWLKVKVPEWTVAEDIGVSFQGAGPISACVEILFDAADAYVVRSAKGDVVQVGKNVVRAVLIDPPPSRCPAGAAWGTQTAAEP
jgi:hypothetical protein